MPTLRGFAVGAAGGVFGAAFVLTVLVLVFDLGQSTKTVVSIAPSPVAYASGAQGLSPDQIYKSLSGGVVMVLSSFGDEGVGPFGDAQTGQALGTGFVVDEDGYILTNAHVVNDQGQSASSVTVVFRENDAETTRVKGELVGVDVSSDVAVIKVDPKGLALRPLPLGDSGKVIVGEPVVAIGNPLGYDFSITSGIVSATGRSLQAPNGMTIANGIQTDAAINRGNSGGPLIDGRGRVIGINEQIASQSGGSQGLGFAVPINTAVRSLNQLRENGKVEYAWLGVTGQTLSSDVAAMFGIDTSGGVLVEEVSPGSPAATAGIRGGGHVVSIQDQTFTLGGDIIVKIDATPIASFDDLVAYLSGKRPGDEVTLILDRDGEHLEVTATLAERP
jgi:S1-C subfamily serine protease